MARFKLALLLAVLCCLFARLAVAQAFDLQKLADLHQSGDARAAYAYAREFLDQQEGDPDFDYYYGIAAIDTGNASQGVFALERVLALDPDNHAARLELARGYFILAEYDRAREEFELVLATGPPANVSARITRFLETIQRKQGRYRTTATGYAEIGAGYDSNVNAGPEDGELGNGIQLDPDSVETADSYLVVAAGGQLSVPVSSANRVFGVANVDSRHNADKSEFDNQTFNLLGGWAFNKSNYQLQADLQYQGYRFDGDTFRKLTALNGEWRLTSSQNSQWSVFGQYAGLQYPDLEVRDSNILTLGAGYTMGRGGALSPIWFFNGYGGTEDPDSSSAEAKAVADRTLYGGRVGTQLTLGGRSLLLLTLSAQRSEYAGADLIFNEKREDTYASGQIEWRWLLGRVFSLRSRLFYANNSSNIELFQYDRGIGEVRLRADFY